MVDRGGTGPACVALAGLLLLVVGCGTPGPRPVDPRRDLHDPSPARRTQAVLMVAQERREASVPALIEMLDDEDPAVRLAAAETLTRLTGRATDYRPWDDATRRRAAVLDWRAWWASQPGEREAQAPPPTRVRGPAPRPQGVAP